MIFRFLVDPEAIAACGADPIKGRLETQGLMRAWRKFGILLVESGESGEQFQESINDLPHDMKTLWKSALKQLRRANAPENWRGLTEIQGSKDFLGLQTSADMAYLDEYTWVIAGFDPGEFIRRVPSGMEVVKIWAIDYSQTVRNAEEVAHQEIVLGTSTEEVWRSRFKESARHATVATIVDRYCIDEIIKAREPRTASNDSGLYKFLVNCDRDASNRDAPRLTVKIFAKWPVGVNSRFPKGIEEHLVEEKIKQSLPTLARGGVQRIEIHLIPDIDMLNPAHGRYVRFGTDYLMSLDTGITVLSKRKVAKDCSFNMMPTTPYTKKKEVTMLSQARKSVFVSA